MHFLEFYCKDKEKIIHINLKNVLIFHKDKDQSFKDFDLDIFLDIDTIIDSSMIIDDKLIIHSTNIAVDEFFVIQFFYFFKKKEILNGKKYLSR